MILEEYVDRIVSVVERNCSNVELQLNVGLTRTLPEGAETVHNTISETFKQDQCDALLHMLNFTSPNFDLNKDSITFKNMLVFWNSIIDSYPRLYYLNDATEPTSFDTDESRFNSLQLSLKAAYSEAFSTQYYWVVSSDNPNNPVFENGVDFWVINETQLSRRFLE